jgi:metallo-beta-lactamase class B
MITPWGQRVVPDPSVAADITAWKKLGPDAAWPDRASAWWKDPANTGSKVVQHYPWRLTDNLYVLGHDDDTLPLYLFDTGSGLLLIDTAFAAWGPSLAQQIRQTGRDPHQVRWAVVTHHHGDHSGGVPYWRKQGAEIWAPAADADTLRAASIMVDRTYKDGDVLAFGRVSLRAIGTPGHTRGSTCFYCEWSGRKILFGEDITLHAGRQAWMGGPDSNWDDYLASLEKLCSYRIDGTPVTFEMLLPGHGTVDLDQAAKSVRDTRDIVREIVNRRRAGEDIAGMDVYKWQWEHRKR